MFLGRPEKPRSRQEICQTFRETACHTLGQEMCQKIRHDVFHKADQGVFYPFDSGRLRGARTPDPWYVQVILCRQALRDVQIWSFLTREERRDPEKVTEDLPMNADAGDVTFSGTLCSNLEAATPGLWVAQGF